MARENKSPRQDKPDSRDSSADGLSLDELLGGGGSGPKASAAAKPKKSSGSTRTSAKTAPKAGSRGRTKGQTGQSRTSPKSKTKAKSEVPRVKGRAMGGKPKSSNGRHRWNPEPEEKPKSMWDEEKLPTLLTLPVLFAILAFVLTWTSLFLFPWYTFKYHAEAEDEDFEGETKVDWYLGGNRARIYEQDSLKAEYGKTYTVGNSSLEDEFWPEDEYSVIPLFRNLSYLARGAFLMAMAAGILTVFTRQGLVPFDTKNLTAVFTLLLIGLSAGSALYMAATTPSTLQDYLEYRAQNDKGMNKAESFSTPFIGSYTENDIFLPSSDGETLLDGKVTFSYYPGPAWFIMMFIVPALGYATYYYQNKENAGEEQLIAGFLGVGKEKKAKEPRSAPKGISAYTNGKGKAKGRAKRGKKARDEPSSGERISLDELTGGAPGGGSQRRETAPKSISGSKAKPSARGKATPSPTTNKAKGRQVRSGISDPEMEAKFRKLVDEYKQFTNKQKLSSNELAKLKAMALKK